MNKHWKSRKLWMFIALQIIGTLIWYWADTSEYLSWVEFTKWNFGIFIFGNGVEHGSNAIKEGMKSKNGINEESEESE